MSPPLGFLKCVDGIFQLGRKVINTIGADPKSHLFLDTPGASFHHAVVEYSERDECYYLEDQTSSEGTFVNDCQINMAVIRLIAGNIVRFGFNGIPFEFAIVILVTSEGKIRSFEIPPDPVKYCDGLPRLLSVINRSQVPDCAVEPSAGDACCSHSFKCSRPRCVCGEPVDDNLAPRWIEGGTPIAVRFCLTAELLSNVKLDPQVRETVTCLVAEVRRLAGFECGYQLSESLQKELKDEVTYLQNKLRGFDIGCHIPHPCNTDVMVQTDPRKDGEEPDCPRSLILSKSCASTVSQPPSGCCHRPPARDPCSAVSVLTGEESSISLSCMDCYECQIENALREKNTALGYLAQIQCDMANKDITICCMARQLEKANADVLEMDCANHAMTEMLLRRVEPGCSAEDFYKCAAAERKLIQNSNELILLRYKSRLFPIAEQQMMTDIASLEMRCRCLTASMEEHVEYQKMMQKAFCEVKTRNDEIERAELQARVDLEQMKSKYERLRSIVTQAAFSQKPAAPRTNEPTEGSPTGSQEKNLTDDEITAGLKQFIEEHTCAMRKLEESEKSTKNPSVSNANRPSTTQAQDSHLVAGRVSKHGQ